MVAAREGRGVFLEQEVTYEEFIASIDWNRVLIQAYGEHERAHEDIGVLCGSCIQTVLLRKEEPYSEERCVHYATAEILYEVTVDEPNLNRTAVQCKECIGESIYLLSRYGRLKVERA